MAGQGESKTSERRIKAREKQGKALEYRKGGVTYQKIADLLGYKTPTGAEKAVKAALDRITEAPAKQVRKLELERLDAILTSIWGQIAKGHLGAIDRAIKIMERRARYLGLDTPLKQEHFLDGNINIEITTPEKTKKEFSINGNKDSD
jgi:hypothetical protein